MNTSPTLIALIAFAGLTTLALAVAVARHGAALQQLAL